MALSTFRTVVNIAELRQYTGADVSRDAIEVLGYYNESDGGGGTFYWVSNSGQNDNDGTIIKPTVSDPTHDPITQPYTGAGRWLRVFDNQIDVKWFGATGNWNEAAGTGTDDTVALQKAFDFIKSAVDSSGQGVAPRKNYNIFLSKGTYKISSTLSINVKDYTYNVPPLTYYRGRLLFSGAGDEESIIVSSITDGSPALHVIGSLNWINEFRDFSMRSNLAVYAGPGLRLENVSSTTLRNVGIWYYERGIYLYNTLLCEFETVLLRGNNYGLFAERATENPPIYPEITLPNVLRFIKCGIIQSDTLGVFIKEIHSCTFESCTFEYNGRQALPTTPIGGIDCTYNGANGGNGLNVSNCYFEGNRGIADIRVQMQAGSLDNPYYGTHTFKGNTFNRNLNLDSSTPAKPLYTNHNILIVGDGQNPKRKFGQSKMKLVFIGNGFFTHQPGVFPNNYIPDPSRRAIEIQYYTDPNGVKNYWEFDIVDEGNAYSGLIDGPLYDTKTPQISEHTRVKAMASVNVTSLAPIVMTIGTSYNIDITSSTRVGVGDYHIYLANPLPNSNPVILVTGMNLPPYTTPIPLPAFQVSYNPNTSVIRVLSRNSLSSSGAAVDAPFHLLVM